MSNIFRNADLEGLKGIKNQLVDKLKDSEIRIKNYLYMSIDNITSYDNDFYNELFTIKWPVEFINDPKIIYNLYENQRITLGDKIHFVDLLYDNGLKIVDNLEIYIKPYLIDSTKTYIDLGLFNFIYSLVISIEHPKIVKAFDVLSERKIKSVFFWFLDYYSEMCSRNLLDSHVKFVMNSIIIEQFKYNLINKTENILCYMKNRNIMPNDYIVHTLYTKSFINRDEYINFYKRTDKQTYLLVAEPYTKKRKYEYIEKDN